MKIKFINALAVALAAFALVGCRTAPPSIYQWGSYEPQLNGHFKGESPIQQIVVMEKHLQTASTHGKQVPPGFHAHLGMLYSIAGRPDQVAAQFQEEKRLFPESEPYMNRLLETLGKGGH
ncbi:DUF4810 domain-containing protein [Massilia sp. CCM 8695]|uniref:DUF4810 domain-containing protein n=1 Tax=Massilia frigida TaxID=2609281 RepID=A0ABX0N856_9BURK|nr:DUF4810 domain-containing protein [Massilia frigida]NHZ78934.1 DUF4810 domain-containing protein [Massilia frigida]